jgi:hypothetical protein
VSAQQDTPHAVCAREPSVDACATCARRDAWRALLRGDLSAGYRGTKNSYLCEHVPFHMCMRRRGLVIGVLPSLAVECGATIVNPRHNRVHLHANGSVSVVAKPPPRAAPPPPPRRRRAAPLKKTSAGAGGRTTAAAKRKAKVTRTL